MEGLTPGRIVHFVMPNGAHRPAMVVEVWGPSGCSNLQVFLDGLNDKRANPSVYSDTGLYWATSINPDEENKQPHSWHWIERA